MSDRKQQILELAADLLQTKGYDSFSYQDLSRELGITKASIHHHFARKEDLGIALCEWTGDWLTKVYQHIDASTDSAWERLERYLHGAMSYVEREGKCCPLAALHNDVVLLPESMQNAMKKVDQVELDWFTKILRLGRERGEFDFEGEPEHLATLLVMALKGAYAYNHVHGQNFYCNAMKQFKTLIS